MNTHLSMAGRWTKRIVFSSVLVAICVSFLVLVFHANTRHQALNVVRGLYETGRQYTMRLYLLNPDFSTIVPLMERQLDFVEALKPEKSRLSANFLNTMSTVMENARTQRHFELLQPLLKRMASIEEKAFVPQLWLAEAMQTTGHPKAMEQINYAISLMPADDRGYRLAIRQLVETGDISRVGAICSAWRQALHGGLTMPRHYNLYDGLTNRRIVLQAVDTVGKEVFSGAQDVTLNTRQRYEFRFEAPVSVRSFNLELATFPGVRLEVHEVEFLQNGQWQKVADREFLAIPSDAFFDEAGGMLLGYRGYQNVRIVVGNPDELTSDNDGTATALALKLSFDKLSLADTALCPRGAVE